MRSTNAKAGVVATFNSIVLGTTARCLENVVEEVDALSVWTGCSLWWLLIPVLFSGVSLVLTALAVIPYLESSSGSERSSLIFFRDIASKEAEKYVEEATEIDDAAATKDLARQVHAVSEGAYQKFCYLQFAFRLLIVAGISILILYPFYL